MAIRIYKAIQTNGGMIKIGHNICIYTLIDLCYIHIHNKNLCFVTKNYIFLH